MQSLCGKLYKEKIIFLNGSPCDADSVFISPCVRRCASESATCEIERVLLNLSACECFGVCVRTQDAYCQA